MFSIMGFYFKTYFKSLKNYIPILIIACAMVGYCIDFNISRPGDIDIGSIGTVFNVEFTTADPNIDSKLEELENQGRELLYEKNWQGYYDKAIEYLKMDTQYSGSSGADEDTIREIKRYEYLKKENVPYTNEGLDNRAFMFLKALINEPVSIIVIIGVLLCSAQLFSSEVEHKTYKLLYTQPISKTKIYFSKLISAILINFVIVFGTITICFLYQAITKGMGSPKFLVNYALSADETLNNTISYITVGKYILYEIGFMSLIIIFASCIGATLSLIINTSAGSICSSTVILGLLYVWFKSNSFAVVQKYNPLAYVDINRIMSLGNISSLEFLMGLDPVRLKELHREGKVGTLVNLSLSSGTMVLCVSIVALICINLFIVNKKTIAK